MANRTESYIKLNKESIRGTAEGVLVIFGDDQGYGHQVVKGGDHANLDMLKTIMAGFEAGSGANFVIINHEGQQVYPQQGQKGAKMSAQKDKNGFVHINDGEKKDVYFVIALNDRYHSYEGAETVEALATKIKQIQDSPAKLGCEVKGYHASQLIFNEATGRYEQVQGPHFYPGPVPVESAKEKEA